MNMCTEKLLETFSFCPYLSDAKTDPKTYRGFIICKRYWRIACNKVLLT